MVWYEIPGRPVTKKNSMQMAYSKAKNRWFPVPSKAYKKFQSAAKKALEQKPQEPIDYPVVASCVYYLNRNKDGSLPKNCPDLANLLEATMDVLVENKILADDNSTIVVSHNDSRVVFLDYGEPMTTEILIYQPGEETDQS